MDFLVSLEDKTGDHWKAELLIESFKLLNLQDHLTIALAEGPGGSHPEFTRNLKQHKKIYKHKNAGSHPGANKIYALNWCVKEKIIEQPFISIEKTCILCKKPEIFDCAIAFTANRESALDKIPFEIEDKGCYCPVGGCVKFDNLPEVFFNRLLFVYEELCQKQNTIWDRTSRVAMGLCLQEAVLKGYKVQSTNLETNMLGDLQNCFINYEMGFPPLFIPQIYEYTEGITLGISPIKLLATMAPTPASHWLNTVATHCIK